MAYNKLSSHTQPCQLKTEDDPRPKMVCHADGWLSIWPVSVCVCVCVRYYAQLIDRQQRPQILHFIKKRVRPCRVAQHYVNVNLIWRLTSLGLLSQRWTPRPSPEPQTTLSPTQSQTRPERGSSADASAKSSEVHPNL